MSRRKPIISPYIGELPKKPPRAKRPSEIRKARERQELKMRVVNVFEAPSGDPPTTEQIMALLGRARKADLTVDSGDAFLGKLEEIAAEDAAGLKRAQESYGNSWKSRGGVGAFMMLARKWDRLENRVKRPAVGEGGIYDVFAHVASDQRAEGVIDDIRDLRRYLLLVEAELRARGLNATHRDNK